MTDGILNEEDKFIPETEASDARPVISEYKGTDTSQPVTFSSGREDDSGREAADENYASMEEQDTSGIDDKRKAIGKWGQDLVYNDLKKEFADDSDIIIIGPNERGETVYGADFIVRKAGKDIKYVEVKSTDEKRGKPQTVRCRQWEAARYYVNENEGDKYWIYCVFEAGSKTPPVVTVQNPHQKWKDGLLRAHPVSFIIQ